MKIRTTGLKEHDQDVELGRLTIVSAPNETGKSTLAEAIRFAALGFVPALGKRPIDTAALMCGGKMEVALELSDGRTLTRELSRAPKGALAGAVECSWLKNAKAAEHHQEILKLFGKEEADVAEVLDIRQLLSATPNKRAARIEALMAAGLSDPKQTAQLIAELTTRRLAKKEEAKLDNWKTLLPILSAEERDALKKVSPMLLAKVQDGGIAAALTWANEEKKDANNALKHKTEARKEIERRLEELPKTEPGKLDDLKAERERLQREMGAARQRAEDAEKVASSIERAGELLHDVANKVMRAEATASKQKEIRKNTDGQKKRLAKIQKQLDALKAPTPPDLSEAEELDQQGTEAEKELDKEELLTDMEYPTNIGALEARLDALENAQDKAANSPWAEVLKIGKELAAYKTKKVQAHGERIVRIATEQVDDPQALGSELYEVRSDLDKARARDKQAREENTKRAKKREEIKGRIAELRERADDKRKKTLLTHKGATTEFDAKRTKLRDESAKLRTEMEEGEKILAESGQNLNAAKADHKAAKQRLADLGDAPDAKALDAERLQLQDRLDKVIAQVESVNSGATVKAELESLVEEIESLGTVLKVFKALEWAAQRAREKEISQAEGPLVKTMVAFLDAAGRPERPYFRAGKGHVDIGWTKNGQDVAVQVLSGAAYTLFTTALTAAVLTVQPSALRVLLVEAGEMDPESLEQLLAGIAAVGKDLTASLVMTHREIKKKRKGWDLLRLPKKELETAEA